MRAIGQTIFWASIAAVAYAYAIYPVLIYLASRLFGRKAGPPATNAGDLPGVSLLIAAHNEREVIEARIINALGLDYPKDRLEIVIASDGSADGTAEIARNFPGVRVLDYPIRRGKAATLNEAMNEVTGRIVILSDANTMMDAGAIGNLVRWFEDPGVGVVCGRLILVDAARSRNVDGLYWRYETFLKKCEARLGALLGSNGAIYAIRREMFEPIPSNTIVDDFVIPLLAKLRSGCSIIYDAEAVGAEETPAEIGQEFRRRARIGAGGFQAITMVWRLLDPRRGWIAFSFFSHKVMRWCCPFFLCGALVSSMLVYRPMFLAQMLFYICSLTIPIRGRLRLATMFTSMNAALLVGFFQWLTRPQRGIWQRTERAVDAKSPPRSLAA